MEIKPELAVVVPVYNEAGLVGEVVRKWIQVLRDLKIRFELRLYNDGSKDNTAQVLHDLEKQYPELKVINKSNSGHGPTILRAYREAFDADWIFQMDSDDELGPEPFPEMWKRRERFDFLIGYRTDRDSPLSRKIMTAIAGLSIRLFYGSGIKDANCPYRLLRTSKFHQLLESIPHSTFAPNLIICGYAAARGLRIFDFPVKFVPRKLGTGSLFAFKLVKASWTSFKETLMFRFRLPD